MQTQAEKTNRMNFYTLFRVEIEQNSKHINEEWNKFYDVHLGKGYRVKVCMYNIEKKVKLN